jgi:hypothetical protein
MKALGSLEGTVSQVEVDENVEEADLIREAAFNVICCMGNIL